MDLHNDIDRLINRSTISLNNDSDTVADTSHKFIFTKVREQRTHKENEELAYTLASRLGVNTNNLLPYLAACYTGIAKSSLERYAALAVETGKVPAKLFMWFVGQEPLWQERQTRRMNDE